MSVARILVPAFGAQQDRIALAAALRTARLFAGHVQVLAVHPYPANAVPNVGVPLSPAVMQSIIDGQMDCARSINAHLRDMIASLCACEGATHVQAPVRQAGTVTCSFRALYGDAERTMVNSAALSDLIVFGPRGRDTSAAAQVFLDVLRKAQKPVLMTKQAPTGRLRKILVGWDGSQSAARAVRQAVPFLRCVERVSVISIVRDGPEPSTEALEAYLTRQEVHFHCRAVFPGRLSAADALLVEAQNEGADLIVAGGYGHDQLWEAFFGGATASLVSDPVVPVFLVH